MEQKYIDKIPKKMLVMFEKEKEKEHKIKINPNISLDNQGLQRKTLVLLAMINLNYWCEEEEKQELLKLYLDNDKRKESELREKYNLENIFNNKIERKKEKNLDVENKNLIEYKEESILKKIFNKIINLLRK